jgi:predicted PurR-regulated permease PerM
MAERKLITLQSIALPMLAVAGASAFFYYAAPIVIPVIMAATLAYSLNPFVSALNRLKLPQVLSVILVLLLSLLILVAVGYLIFLQLNELASNLPQYWTDFLQLLEKVKLSLTGKAGIFNEQLQKLDFSHLDSKYLAQAGQYLLKGVGSIFSFLFASLLIFFLAFFMLNDQKVIKSKLLHGFGSTQTEAAQSILTEINSQIRAFIQVKFWTTVVLSIVFTLGLVLLGVNYPYIWGPLAGVANLIPFVGSVLGAVPPVIMALIQSDGLLKPILVIIFFTIVQLIESNLVSPKIMGDKVNLSPLAVLIASLYWGWLWGGIGVVLAVPITAALKVVCDHVETLKPIGILLGGRRD